MGANETFDYHHWSIRTPIFEGKGKALHLVLFLLLRSSRVRSRVDVLRSDKSSRPHPQVFREIEIEGRGPTEFESR